MIIIPKKNLSPRDDMDSTDEPEHMSTQRDLLLLLKLHAQFHDKPY